MATIRISVEYDGKWTGKEYDLPNNIKLVGSPEMERIVGSAADEIVKKITTS